MKLINKRKIEKQISYDIEVKDTHCFFANGVLAHNSNSSVGYNNNDGIWAQSRNKIITIDNDNAGFAFFVEKNKEAFLTLIQQVIKENKIDADNNNVYIFGEWAGKGIQKNMGINKLDKFIAIFGVKVAPFDDKVSNYWVNCDNLRDIDNRIYNINDFEKYEIEIDFNNPGEAQNKMIDMMLKVEENSPFSNSFGEKGIGEGIVFSWNSLKIVRKNNIININGKDLSKGLNDFLLDYIEEEKDFFFF